TVTALSGANPTGAAIVDFVGFATGANAREPQATGVTADNAPGTTANVAIQRLNCGGSDTNRNATDFAQIWPNPHNSTTAAGNGLQGIATVFPYILKAGQPAR